MAARWGTELWDQRGAVERRIDDGIAAVERTRNFVGQLAAVEAEYAKSLRKVVKSFAAPADESTQGQAWKALLESVEEIANFHDGTAGGLMGDLTNGLKLLAKNKQKEREDISRVIMKLEGDLARAADEYDKAKKKFEKAEKEADVAKQVYLKSENADNLTKKQVEKTRQTWAQKAKLSEGIQQALAQQTTEFNATRTLHFHTQMPTQFDQYQALDESRAEGLVQSYAQVGRIYRDSSDQALQSLRKVDAAVGSHNKVADSTQFARVFKTNQPLPGDIDVPVVTASGFSEDPRRQSSLQSSQAYADDDEDMPPPPPPPAAAAGPAAGEPIIRYRAAYAFPGTNPGELPLAEGDILTQIENDNSGWVLVAKADNSRGYAPESYITRI